MAKTSKAQKEAMEQQAQQPLPEAPSFEKAKPAIHTYNDQGKKNGVEWKDMSNADREESVRQSDRNLVGQHAKAMKERGETAYYMKDATKQELEATLPYNARTGQPFNGWLEEKMRMHTQLNNFKESKYMTLDQAHSMGIKMQTLKDKDGNELINEKSGKPMYPIGVKFAYLKEYEKVPVKDKDGNIMYQKDEKGNDITYTDRNGETHKNPVTEVVKLKEPKVETKTFYNVEQLDCSQQKYAFKEKDLTNRREFQANLEKNEQEVQSNLSQFGLLPLTQKNLERHMDATTMGRDFKAIEKTIKLEPTQNFVQKQPELDFGR